MATASKVDDYSVIPQAFFPRIDDKSKSALFKFVQSTEQRADDQVDLLGLTDSIMSWTDGNKEYGKFIATYFKSALNLDIQNFQSDQGVKDSIIKTDLELLKTNTSEFENSFSDKLARFGKLQSEAVDIDAQLSKEVVTDQGATLLKKKEENTKEQAHLENYFNSWKNIGSTLKIPPEMQRMFDQAPKIIDGFDKLSNSSFGQDPSSYANVFVGVFAMATQMAQGSDNTPSPWNGLFDALRTISGQIERMQQLMVLNFKMLNLNLDDRFAQLDSLTQAIADAQKGQTQELSHITNQLSQFNKTPFFSRKRRPINRTKRPS